jgi:HD-GYP domain-containing protein (c-di-GMP phosphodiesterase class II)
MRLAFRERLVVIVVTGLGIALVPAVLILTIGFTRIRLDGNVHFYALGLSALAATAAATALTIVGARYRDTRTVLVGTAFAVMAALLALHGIATPGVLFGDNGVVAFTGGATMPVGAAILALSTFRLPSFLSGVRPLLALQFVLLATVLALGASGLVFPSLVPPVPAANSPSALFLLGVGLILFCVILLRAFRTFVLTRRLGDLAVVVGVVWLATALVPALTQTWSQLGWWIGHALELDAILLVGIAVAIDLARAVQSRPLAGDLSAAELVTAEDVYLGSHVHAVMLRLAHRDTYTEQHTRRVALRAVQVGEVLGLSRNRLRALAIGALVHDIGKLSVPDSILKKPGALDDDEFAVIRKHPEWGTRLLDELGGFSDSVRRLVQDHHERLDGKGYPHGLSEDDIDLDTRILTVCDVYDALISARVYRPAWTHEDSIALLRKDIGTAFDPRCVAALEQVLAGESEALGPSVVQLAVRRQAALAGVGSAAL